MTELSQPTHPDLGSHPSLDGIDHRPWPLPNGHWIWRQSWIQLAFLHWPVPAAALRPLVHPDLEVQEFDGTSWVGVVPFRMEGVAPRNLPAVPGLSDFPELNVRLYVQKDGKPGVWFLSLDAPSRTAVAIGSHFNYVPYHLADIDMTTAGNGFHFDSRRRGEKTAVFNAEYAPTSEVYNTKPGSLEHFLTERYCLYAATPDGTLLHRTEVHHQQWPLQKAQVKLSRNTVTAATGLPQDGPPPLIHYSEGVDVVVWPAQRCDGLDDGDLRVDAPRS